MSQWLSRNEAIAIVVMMVIVNVIGWWAIDHFQTEIRLIGHRGVVPAIAFVDRHHIVATACSDGKLRLFSTHDGTPLREITGHSDQLTDVTSFAGAEDVATASADGTIQIRKMPEGIQRRSIAAHAGLVLAAKYSDDGSVLVSIGADRALRVWNPSKGEREQEIVVRFDLNCLAVNSTGSMAATNGPEHATVIWNLRSGKELHRIVGHDGATVAIAFSHDGNRIVTSSDDRILRIFDASNYKQLRQIEGNHCRANSVHFTNDDKLVVSAMADGVVKLWNSSSGELERSFQACQNEILCVASSSLPLMATGTRGRTATLWRF